MGERHKSLFYFLGGVACLVVALKYLNEIGILGWSLGLFGLILLERGTFVLRGLKPRQ